MATKNKIKDLYGYWLSNQSTYSNNYNFSEIYCHLVEYPDYLCLSKEKSKYHLTANTCLCFYEYDEVFDKIDGIYNSIIYNDKKKLNEYKRLYKGIKYVIPPDYSTYLFMDKATIIMQIKKSRLVALWFKIELNCVVIPSITYAYDEYNDICLEGIEYGSAIAISLKGSCRNLDDRRRLKKIIEECINKINPECIIVYATCKNKLIYDVMKYAYEVGTQVIIPNNSIRNDFMSRDVYYG